jgi:RNA polymerase sigma factor (sigma-70 family)
VTHVLMMAEGALQATDDALMVRVIARDRDAFRLLVERHGDRPYRLAWRMLNDAIEAEDVAQESLLRLWSYAEKWKGGQAGVAAWLARVATNLCLDRLRRKRFQSDEEPPERADDALLADGMIASDQERTRTIAAIQALPAGQRAAILLTYYEDHSNQMAADAMDMKIKAFESLLHRARAALRLALADLKGDAA